jgi:adenylate cyclase
MEIQVPSLAKGQRTLAAIMITDAVGFSARMSVNEELTLQLIDRDLALITEICQEFGGTVLKSTGDGLLIYFLSAVEAVSCGLDIQRRLAELAQGLSAEQYLDHRIGIHLGDILVSQQDVMGNGVNITARLQTYAKPGGLCVSKMIFDVVKARLNLHATFLGPLTLKHIQETVPAYQLSLQADDADSQDEPQILDEPTCPMSVSPEDLLNSAAASLQADVNSQRIKKLIFAAYQQTWENDPAVLEQFSFHDLLKSLRERYPTLEELEPQFQRIVMGLNRQVYYTQIATTILKQIRPWYAHQLAKATVEPSLQPADQPYRDIAQQLEQTSDSLRVRKLLYCLVNNRWQNSLEILQEIDLEGLVQATLETAPHRQDLQYHLQRIIKHLNRRGEYRRIAREVIHAFQAFYDQENDDSSLRDPSDGGADVAQADQTMMTQISPVASADNELTTLHSSLSTPTSLADNPLPDVTPDRDPLPLSSLFDLRIEIVQYANPLRAKILLYSCLHGPFCYTDEAWSALRRQSLDELLWQVFDYCPTYADLESKLTIIAHCLDQPDESRQAAGVVARAMKAYYPSDPKAPIEAHQPLRHNPKSQRGSRSDVAPVQTQHMPLASSVHHALSPA